jgi:argininosuccinate lyase
MTFRDAHHAVGTIVRQCIDRGIGLEDLNAGDLDSLLPGVGAEAVGILRVEQSVYSRSARGGTGVEAVKAQLDRAASLLQNRH